MSQLIDVAEFLMPISEEMPCGENLEYDPQFVKLELVATPKAERVMGDSIKPAEEPDWGQVESLSREFLGHSKDLRAAVYLTSAWLRTQGLSGWASGLVLIHGLLEKYWESVYPQLDAEDNNDPTARCNSVSVLTDPLGILGYFRHTTFVRSPRLGQFSLHSLRIASGTLPSDTGESPSMTEIEACCMDCAEQDLVDTLAVITEALEHVEAIDRIFNEQVGTEGPDFKNLLQDHRDLVKFIHSQVKARVPSFDADSPVMDAPDSISSTGEDDAGMVKPTQLGQIRDVQDVIRLLDAICEYYAKHEPSSPVPLLLRRAQRLVGADFIDLIKELAPSGLSEIQVFSGPEN